MTRINVIDPVYLTDQHLMAEYRELPMIMGSLRRSLRSPKPLPAESSKYTLNRGHVTFFYRKGKFLKRRYTDVVVELIARGYNLDPNRRADFQVFIDNDLFHDWTPDDHARAINTERLVQRINKQPQWYRYYGDKLTDSFFAMEPWKQHFQHRAVSSVG